MPKTIKINTIIEGELTIGDYTLAVADGTVGQVMTTDGAGAITFETPSIGGAGAFTTNGITTTETASIYTDDFVFGSPQLDDDTDVAHFSRLFFDKGKYAIRAGTANSTQWDTANLGSGSTAFGRNTTASGQDSFAVGQNAIASGLGDMALGINTEANGGASIAIGVNTTASGYGSIAAGDSTIASGNQSMAIGSGTEAIGSLSIAAGINSVASGNYSIAAGYIVEATAASATAIGNGTTASGSSSTATGLGCTASGQSSFAMGLIGHAYLDNSMAHGSSNSSLGQAQYVRNVPVQSTSDALSEKMFTTQSVGDYFILPASTAWAFSGTIIARQESGSAGTIGDTHIFEFKGGIKRDAANNTTLIGAITISTLVNDAGAAAWVVAIAADDTTEELAITITGEVNKTIHWVGKLELVEVG